MVIPASDQLGYFYILDRHLRLEALEDLAVTTVECLIARDDETYTYNKQINRLSPPQAHRMIARAIERGVPEARLAKRSASMSPQFSAARGSWTASVKTPSNSLRLFKSLLLLRYFQPSQEVFNKLCNYAAPGRAFVQKSLRR